MPAKLIIPTGTQYGRWTVVSEEKPGGNRGHARRFLCKCACNKTAIVRLTHLRRGTSKSCGCWCKENSTRQATKHGFAKHKAYSAWKDMMRRCYNPNHRRYADWGGRGIKVCPEWHDVSTFALWSEASGYRHGLLIERIDNNRDYSPGNCKWATMKDQGNNRRNSKTITFQGKTMTETQWAESLGITQPALHERLNRGWPLHRALVIKNLQPERKNHD